MKRHIGLVYASGIAQGLALIAFPAAGNLFRSPGEHALTASEYGALFLPLYALAVTLSTAAGALGRRFGMKRVYVGGLACNVLSMALLAASHFAVASHAVAFMMLLWAIGALGAGFGATLTAINTFVPRYFPARADTALTVAHALVGVGTALPALLLPLFIRLGGWWLEPIAFAALLGALALVAARRAFPEAAEGTASVAQPLRGRVRMLVCAAAVYGICEAIFGNWGAIYLHEEVGLDLSRAGLALSLFWGMLTAGRLLIAALSAWIPSRFIHVALPLVIGGAFLAVARAAGEAGGLVAFAVAGLGCSAFLPLSIGFAGEGRSGIMLAAFMLGSGVGAFGVGPLHLPLGRVFAFAVGLAVLLLAFAVAAFQRRTSAAPTSAQSTTAPPWASPV